MGKRKSPLVNIITRRHGDKNKGHHHVILDEIDDNYVSVGLTTKAKKGKNHPNYKLDRDPFGSSGASYMRRSGSVHRKVEYSASTRKGTMTPKDYSKAVQYGNSAKNRYIVNKKKK